MGSNKNLVPLVTAFLAVLLLSGCGDSVENEVLGSWKAVTGGEVTGYLEINEDRYTIKQESDENLRTVEYIVTETEDDKFIMEAVNPDNGSLEFLFEGYFENKNKIAIVGDPGNANGESGLFRVDSIAKDMEKNQKTDEVLEEKNNEAVKKEEKTEKEVAAETEEIAKPSYYRQKADSLDEEAKAEAKKVKTQNLPNGFYLQFYYEWDDLLNEVWAELKSSMTANEFERLKTEQNEWITQKEAGFAEFSDEVASERLRAMDFLAFETKDRTYFLIENHLE